MKKVCKEYCSKIIEKIRKNTSLETRLRVYLQLQDIEHWNNGEYSGDVSNELEYILKKVEKWLEDKAPLKDENKNK